MNQDQERKALRSACLVLVCAVGGGVIVLGGLAAWLLGYGG